MPLNDPRLLCPHCGNLVEVEVERFEDMFDDSADVACAAPLYHEHCFRLGAAGIQAASDRVARVYEYDTETTGRLTDGSL